MCLLDKGAVAVEERMSLDCMKGEGGAHGAHKNVLNLCVDIRRFLKVHRSGGKTNLTYAVAHRRLLRCFMMIKCAKTSGSHVANVLPRVAFIR